MAQLSTKIKLYCEANSKTVDFTKDVLLQDDSDGKGPYIKEWNVSGLAQPTDEQLALPAAGAPCHPTPTSVRTKTIGKQPMALEGPAIAQAVAAKPTRSQVSPKD